MAKAMVEMGRGEQERNDGGITTSNDGEDDNNDQKPAAKPMVVDDGGKGLEETCTALNNVVIEEGGAEAVADGGRDDNIFEGGGNNLRRGKEEKMLTDGANVRGCNAVASGGLVEDSLVEDMDKTGEETETTLTDGIKDPGSNTGANGSSVDVTNEIVIEEGSAEAAADGGRDNNVFEGGENNLGQGEDRATLRDGAKDVGWRWQFGGQHRDNIDRWRKEPGWRRGCRRQFGDGHG